MFGINVSNLPSCRSYQEALSVWENAKDCSTKDVWGQRARPLDSVRMRHKAVTKHADDSISFDLYQTEMVRYYSDGTVGGTADGRMSSARFFYRVSPHGMWLGNYADCAFLIFDDKNDERNFVLPKDSAFKLKRDGLGRQWQLLVPALQRTRMVPDRKKISAVSKAFKPFYEWVAAAEKVTGRSMFNTTFGWRLELDGITMPPTLDQYTQLTGCANSLDALKLRLNEHFGGYTRIDIPNTERPRRSTLGHWQDT